MGNLLQREFTNIMFTPGTFYILLLMIRMILVFSEVFIGSKISLVYDKSMVKTNKLGV